MENTSIHYSRAGDAFHYRWAARRCLKLIHRISAHPGNLRASDSKNYIKISNRFNRVYAADGSMTPTSSGIEAAVVWMAKENVISAKTYQRAVVDKIIDPKTGRAMSSSDRVPIEGFE